MGGLVKGIGNAIGGVGNALGFSGGASQARQFAADPTAYKELYEKALVEMQGVGRDRTSQAQRDKIDSTLINQLGELDNNAAGRKKNFLEDQARSFQADTQNLARARGGTGTLAQALRPSGAMYDAQARATSRGLNDLYSQATNDLAGLSGVQNQLYAQDANRAQGVANVYQNELASRRGTGAQNLANQYGAEQAKADRLAGTIKGGAQLLGMSDVRQKERITPSEEELFAFLGSLSAYKYHYKDEAYGAGEQFSVMAQDLEKTPVGRAMIVETPSGKMVDYAKGFGALLAAQVALNKRLQTIEAEMRK